VLLLPLFFALTGMRTRLDLLNDSAMWIWAGIVLTAAVFGKMGGAVIAARRTGQFWRNAGIGRPAQYPRPGRTDHFEYRLQCWSFHSHTLHHDGDHGSRDNHVDGSDSKCAGNSQPKRQAKRDRTRARLKLFLGWDRDDQGNGRRFHPELFRSMK